jgi:uncharacterized protein YdbL (DUF1318 family)
MRKFKSPLLLAFGAFVLAACVTINVYFPAAEAQQAASEFVDKVIGDDQKKDEPAPVKPPQASVQPAFNLVSFLISDAQAQEVDINIHTPAIQAIQSRMAERFQNSLQAHFDSGALGFGSDGMVAMRDATKVELKDRVAVKEAVAEDNRDRKALYRELAVANGHPEWEAQLRDTWAKEWIAKAHKGWWYQDGGAWKQK